MSGTKAEVDRLRAEIERLQEELNRRPKHNWRQVDDVNTCCIHFVYLHAHCEECAKGDLA